MKDKFTKRGKKFFPPDQYPDWYWKNGLHDAQIIEKVFLDYNNDLLRDKKKQNCIELRIDSRGSMFDTAVKCLRFYNFKEISGHTNIEGCWWVDDSLRKIENKYMLEIILLKNKKTDKYVIRFESCEVVR